MLLAHGVSRGVQSRKRTSRGAATLLDEAVSPSPTTIEGHR
jgi:hypothetical protein